MKLFFLALAIIIAPAVFAQKATNPQTFANSITPDDLKKHLFVVAGPEMEGRLTATEGQRKAAGYIENHFKSLGLLPGNSGNFQMSYPIFQDSLAGTALEVNGKSYEMNTDYTVNLFNAYSASILCGEVVFVGFGLSDSTRDDYKNVNVRGKIALILSGAPPQASGRNRFSGTAEAAQKNGAIAVLQVQTNFPRRATGNRGTQYLNAFRRTIYPNTFFISEKIAEAIMGADYATAKEAMKNGNPQSKSYLAEVHMELNKVTTQVHSTNVIAYLEGADKKDEYLFITAHYDHLGKRDSVIYYGADDDGSGTVSVLELAEAFTKAKAAGKGPRRTVVFMTVSGEEEGLWGSAYYGDHPSFPLEKTTADLNIDMIGRIDPKRTAGDSMNYVYVVGDDKLSSDLRPISESNNKKYSKLELDYKFNDPRDPLNIYYRSDHYNFARKGVPIIFYFDGIHNDYHRPTDTPDKINYDLMAKRARLVFFTAWEMANRDEMLKRDIPLNAPGRQ